MQFQVPYHGYTEKFPTKLLALYHAFRDSIVTGVLPYQTRLPSSRALAAMYEISRGTVNQVYDMLVSEGYIVSEVGRGSYVSFQSDGADGNKEAYESSYRLSGWGERLKKLRPRMVVTDAELGEIQWKVDFHLFASDPHMFPVNEWNRCLFEQARRLGLPDPSRIADSPLGDEELRACIAQYLRRARGIAAPPEQIAIVNGSMQAIAITAQLLINEGDAVIVENPGYSGVWRAVQSVGGICIPVEVDAHGIVPASWDARLAFVTPNRQFPTGVVLPMERRQQLLRWAYEHDAVIIEDDYDSQFRHRGKSLEPLKVLDREERVIFIGSFSNTLLPSVRIGYAVLPASLVEPFTRAKALYEPQPSGILEQRTLAAWMQNGQYERHLRRMKRVYGRKFHALNELLTMRLSRLFAWVEADAGLHLFGWWRGSAEQYIHFRTLCHKEGIRWSDTSLTDPASGRVRYGAYFHFPHLTEEAMMYGVTEIQRLAQELGLQEEPLTRT